MNELQHFAIFFTDPAGARRRAADAWRIGSSITYWAKDEPMKRILSELLDRDFEHAFSFPGERIRAPRGSREAFEAASKLLSRMGFETTAIEETKPITIRIQASAAIDEALRSFAGKEIRTLTPATIKTFSDKMFGATLARRFYSAQTHTLPTHETGSSLPHASDTESAGGLQSISWVNARA